MSIVIGRFFAEVEKTPAKNAAWSSGLFRRIRQVPQPDGLTRWISPSEPPTASVLASALKAADHQTTRSGGGSFGSGGGRIGNSSSLRVPATSQRLSLLS